MGGYGATADGAGGEARSQRGKRVGLVGVAALVLMMSCLLAASWRGQAGPGELAESAPPVDLSASDKEYCDSFQGWLKTRCEDARRKEASGPAFWTDDEVRGGETQHSTRLAQRQQRPARRHAHQTTRLALTRTPHSPQNIPNPHPPLHRHHTHPSHAG